MDLVVACDGARSAARAAIERARTCRARGGFRSPKWTPHPWDWRFGLPVQVRLRLQGPRGAGADGLQFTVLRVR